ncbi:hypothetical protein L1077_01515 [Pseudoalteromonas luteoviolacea]|uniref:hypothetical protein n=1 Tax=Pseudoalteromonas luteoviolacea TaxID=43657 RepID=UPI001F454022|nr:hypothetical protein [Pseudoalteromonas luteoviolacea]MCF6438109.1 hypothetical protein [Pseudoalteromonas luteoviolacea]
MPFKLQISTFILVFIIVCLAGCASSDLTLNEKIAHQEKIHAHKVMVESYTKNKASIERLAKMEGDLTQLLSLLAVQTEVPDIHSHMQPQQTVVQHKAEVTPHEPIETQEINDKDNVKVSQQKASSLVPDFVLGMHLRQHTALSQIQAIQFRIDMIRHNYPLVFNSVDTRIVEPDPNRTLFYVIASGFSSYQEAGVFCKAMSGVTKRCAELQNNI